MISSMVWYCYEELVVWCVGGGGAVERVRNPKKEVEG